MVNASIQYRDLYLQRCERLERSVGSVLKQTETDLEVLVVDDGSEDATAEVVAIYDSPPVRYVRRNNGGLSAARNTGIESALGEFVIFLDDDDWVEPTWLEALGEAIGSGVGVVSCGHWYEDPGNGSCTTHLPRELSAAFDGVRAIFLAGTFAVRRTICQEIGGYAEDIPTCHQTELALRLLLQTKRMGLTVASVGQPLVHIERRVASKRIWRPEDLLGGRSTCSTTMETS